MRTKIFYNQNQTNYWREIPEKSTSSTLLIPENYMNLFLNKIRLFQNSPRNYLSFLLKSYGRLIQNGILPLNTKLETAYQTEGLNLRRIDFVPDGADWAELKCLKTFLNRSMTSIFVYLLVLDSLGITNHLPNSLANFVVPKVSNFRLVVKITFSRKRFLFARILRHTRDKAG